MRAHFKNLALDDEGLHTPDGLMPLGQITAAEFARKTVTENGAAPTETNTPGIAAGVVVGGVVAGAAGALAGGLIGSTIESETGGEEPYARTTSATIAFATSDATYSADVPAFDVEAAEAFVDKVRAAAPQLAG